MANQDFLALQIWLEETKDEPLEDMAAFFNARMDGYEDHMSPWKEYYSWMASLLPKGIQTLLDIGCGTGLELDEIFKRFPSLSVTGIDLSGEMLARLSQKHFASSLSLIQADYFSYPFPANFFDAAVAFETLHHFTSQKKQQIFSKIRDSLAPGGVFLECDYIAATQEMEDLLFAECSRRRIRDHIPAEKFVHFDTPLTLEHEMQAMRDAGFAKVELIGYRPDDPYTAMIQAVKSF